MIPADADEVGLAKIVRRYSVRLSPQVRHGPGSPEPAGETVLVGTEMMRKVRFPDDDAAASRWNRGCSGSNSRTAPLLTPGTHRLPDERPPRDGRRLDRPRRHGSRLFRLRLAAGERPLRRGNTARRPAANPRRRRPRPRGRSHGENRRDRAGHDEATGDKGDRPFAAAFARPEALQRRSTPCSSEDLPCGTWAL